MDPESRYQSLLVLTLLAVAFLLVPRSVVACAIPPKPTVLQAYDESDIVIIARTISMEKLSDKRFQINPVDAGTYIIIFNYQNKITKQMPFPKLYYPGVADREKSQNDHTQTRRERQPSKRRHQEVGLEN